MQSHSVTPILFYSFTLGIVVGFFSLLSLVDRFVCGFLCIIALCFPIIFLADINIAHTIIILDEVSCQAPASFSVISYIDVVKKAILKYQNMR